MKLKNKDIGLFKFKKNHFILFGIFLLFFTLRVLHFEDKSQFTYDQVDNAWVSKNMIVDHKYPLLGMTARQSSGISIGPLYYYYIGFFYLLTNLDPIASPIAALVASCITFFTLHFVTKKVFDDRVSLLCVFIYSVYSSAIHFDKIQWPVDFIPFCSLLIFYSLYKIITGEVKYFLLLGISLGLSFHVHFTSVLYPIIILFTIPFISRSKKAFLYGLISIGIFVLFLIPNIVASFLNKYYTSGIIDYIRNTNNGIHLRRIFQVAHDAFIEFEQLLLIKPLSYLVVPLFLLIEFYRNHDKKKFFRSYLIMLWFLVPWIGISMYKGDISNYFLTLTRPFAVMIISYLLIKLFDLPTIFSKISVVGLIVIFSFVHIKLYSEEHIVGLKYYKDKGYKQVKESRGNEFSYGAPESYMYYFYSRKLYKWK